MPISATTAYTMAVGNGATTSFPFGFSAGTSAEVTVTLSGIVQTGGFTVTVNPGSNGGVVTFSVAPATGATILIQSAPSFGQTVDFVNAGPFSPSAINLIADQAARRDIALLDKFSRTPSVPPGTSVANTVAGWDAAGNPRTYPQSAFIGPPGPQGLAGSGSSVAAKTAGTLLSAAATGFNFVGAGVTAAMSGTEVQVNVPGGSSSLKVKTPYDFGCVGVAGATQVARDASTDDSVNLQAFFDDAFDPINAGKYYYDWSGCWAISRPMFMVYPFDEVSRRGKMGHLHVLPVASQTVTPFGLTNYVLTLFGTRQRWDGELTISCSSPNGSTGYSYRRYYNGILQRFCSESKFPVLRVDGAKHTVIYMDSTLSQTDSYRVGSAYQILNFTSRSNIGATWQDIYARNCGSSNIGGGLNYTQAVTSSTNGGAPGGTGFVSGESGYANSGNQRTRLVLASTADLQVNDWGKRRIELAPVDYTTIASDNTASTFTFGATNANTAKIVAGTRFTLSSGANSGVLYTVVSVAGAVLTVYPKPATSAATAINNLYTSWNYFQIKALPAANAIDVFPWDNPNNNSVYYSMHGRVLHTEGQDTADIQVNQVGGLNCAVVLGSRGLYGAQIGSLMSDSSDTGLEIGAASDASHSGLSIDQFHIEAAHAGIMQVAVQQNTIIKADSGNVLLQYVWQSNARGSGADPTMPVGGLNGTTIDYGDFRLQSIQRQANEGGSFDLTSAATPPGLSNHPRNNKGTLEGDSGTVYLVFDEDVARLYGEANKAELFWYRLDGTAPTGSLTLQLHPSMVVAGWTVLPSGGLTQAATKSGRYIFVFRPANKTIVLLKP